MKNLLFFSLLLLSVNTYAIDYYGWAGSCENIVYEFDFANKKYTVYGSNRYVQNGKEVNNYFINGDKITQDENGTYYLHSENEGPISLNLENKDERIWGKSKYGNQLFNKCSKEQALKVIGNVQQNT